MCGFSSHFTASVLCCVTLCRDLPIFSFYVLTISVRLLSVGFYVFAMLSNRRIFFSSLCVCCSCDNKQCGPQFASVFDFVAFGVAISVGTTEFGMKRFPIEIQYAEYVYSLLDFRELVIRKMSDWIRTKHEREVDLVYCLIISPVIVPLFTFSVGENSPPKWARYKQITLSIEIIKPVLSSSFFCVDQITID